MNVGGRYDIIYGSFSLNLDKRNPTLNNFQLAYDYVFFKRLKLPFNITWSHVKWLPLACDIYLSFEMA